MPIEDNMHMHVHIQQASQQPKVELEGNRKQKTEVAEEKLQTGKTSGGHTVTVMTKTPMAETDKTKLINSDKTKLDGVAKELGLKNATFMLSEGGQIVAITTKNRRLTLDFGAHVEAGKASLTKEKSSLEAEKGRLTKLAGSLKGNPIDDPKIKASQDKIDARMNEINKTLANLEPRLAQANEKAALLTKVVSQFNESIKGEKKPESSTPDPSASTTKGADQLKSLRERAPIGSHRAASKTTETVAQNDSKVAEKPAGAPINSPTAPSKSGETNKTHTQFNLVMEEGCKTENDFATDITNIKQALDGLIKAAYPKATETEREKTNLGQRLAEAKQLETVAKEVNALFQEANKGSELEKAGKISKVYQSETFKSYFKLLGSYTSNFESLNLEVQNLAKNNKNVSKFMESFQADVNNRGLGVQSFLIKPMQRYMKHPLLIREYIKNTPSGPELTELAKAQSSLERSISQVNEGKRNQEGVDFMNKIRNGPQLSAKSYSDIVLDHFERNNVSRSDNTMLFQVLGSKATPEGRIEGLKLVMEELKNIGILKGAKDESTVKNDESQTKATIIRKTLFSNPEILKGLLSEIAALDKPATDKAKEKFLGVLSLGNARKSEAMLNDLAELKGQWRELTDMMDQYRTGQKRVA